MNRKQYSDRNFHMCIDLLEYLETEMEYRMCSKVNTQLKSFHNELPQRGDTTLTNILLSIKSVGLEKMKSDVSQFLKYYNNINSQKDRFNENNVVG